MAQTPCLRANEGKQVKHTPGAAVIAGQVVVVGQIVHIAPAAIAANVEGVLEGDNGWDVPKVTGAWVQGDQIYWDADADPLGGTAGSGAFTTVGAGNTFAGYAARAAASGDYKGKLNLTPSRSPRGPTQTVAATGTTAADAAAVAEGFNYVTGADDAKGVLLPTASAGKKVKIKVGPGADLKVWPATGDAINGLSVDAALTVVDDVCFELEALDGTTWYTSPLLPS